MPHPIAVTREYLDLSTLSSGTRAVPAVRGGGGGREEGGGRRVGEGGREEGGGRRVGEGGREGRRYCVTRTFKAQNIH